jgi:hypothetical protein
MAAKATQVLLKVFRIMVGATNTICGKNPTGKVGANWA